MKLYGGSRTVDARLAGIGEHQEAAVHEQVDAGRKGVIVVNDDDTLRESAHKWSGH